MMMRALSFGFCLMLSPLAAMAEVLVFAAASLKEPLDALAAEFGDVVVSYGGSGTLARQIMFGAPADVVLLAHPDWMQVLVDEGHVDPARMGDIASNTLVFIGSDDAPDVPLQLDVIKVALGEGRIAIGLTHAVPAGIYGKQALAALNLWPGLSDRLAEVDNVRSALALVARGQAPLGIVYASDARVSPEVRIVARFPPETHDPIRYIGGVTTDATTDAGAFLSFVRGPEGQAALAGAGFLPPWEMVR